MLKRFTFEVIVNDLLIYTFEFDCYSFLDCTKFLMEEIDKLHLDKHSTLEINLVKEEPYRYV